MFGIRFGNTTPDVAAQGIRAVINDQLSRNAYHSGYYDEPFSVANYRALERGPFLSTVIHAVGNTFELRPVVKSDPAYGSIGDLIKLLCGLDDYPLIDDEILSDMTHDETVTYLEQRYPDLDANALARYIYENGNESPYLESGMSLYVPDEEELVAAFKKEQGA